MFDLVFYNYSNGSEICRLSFDDTSLQQTSGNVSWLDYDFTPMYQNTPVQFAADPLLWARAMALAYRGNTQVKAEIEASTLNQAPEPPAEVLEAATSMPGLPMSWGKALGSVLVTQIILGIIGMFIGVLAIIGFGVSLSNDNWQNSVATSAWILLFIFYIPLMLILNVWLQRKFAKSIGKKELSVIDAIVACAIIPLAVYIVFSIILMFFPPLALIAPLVVIACSAAYIRSKALISA